MSFNFQIVGIICMFALFQLINSLVQAEYWHDPMNEDEYKAKSVFLADINQENASHLKFNTVKDILVHHSNKIVLNNTFILIKYFILIVQSVL